VKLTEPEVLSPSEIEEIHEQSLVVLERVGVRVLETECRARLTRAGGSPDPDGETVRLPRELVAECLQAGPSGFRLYRRDGTAVEIDTGSRVYGSLVIDPWIMDNHGRRHRRPVLADVVRHTRLGDALGEVGFLYRMDLPPEDAPREEGYIRTLAAFATHTTKPMMAAPASQTSLRHWLEVGEILAGGRPLGERPPLILCAPVTTPLTFHELNGRILRAGVSHGLPLCAQTEPIAGITAPLSFAGGILMGNCENLFLVVMAQVLKHGTPIAYSTGNAIMDYRTGQAVFYPPEKMLWKIASAQMARFYGLPIGGEATGSMVGSFDTQHGVESALHMLPSVVCGGGMFNGLGSCYNACGMSAEMIVLHTEQLRMVERMRQGIEVSEQTLATGSILRAGPGGHFLEDPLTMRNMRSGEFCAADCFDRSGDQNPDRREASLWERAHQRVEEIIRSHTPAVPDATAAAIEQWAARACR
jgi:trimethylamine--corrinoid protein Co-methyltransferase